MYDVLGEAADRVPDWTWGPNALGAFSTVRDAFGPVPTGGTTLPDALQRVQEQVAGDMRDRGLSVVEGSAV